MFVRDFDGIMKFKTNGIHTFFMKFNIDVILTDEDYKILYIYRDVTPNRIILPKKGVRYTYEIKSDYDKKFEVGMTMET